MEPFTRNLQRNLWNTPKYSLPNPFVSRYEGLSLTQWRYNISKETVCADWFLPRA